MPDCPALRILVVEDYPAIARSLERMLRSILGERVASLEVVAELTAARTHLEGNTVDLLLLDLSLGGDDGFSLLPWATCGSAHTIVVSAHTDRAIEAYAHGVLDFVAKPVRRARLQQALERFDAASVPDRPGPTRRLSVRSRAGYETIPLDRLRRVQAAGKYSTLHLLDGLERTHDKTLERLDALLPPEFMRVHRSHIVRLELVVRLVVQGGGHYQLELSGNETVPVGRTYYNQVRDRLGHGSA